MQFTNAVPNGTSKFLFPLHVRTQTTSQRHRQAEVSEDGKRKTKQKSKKTQPLRAAAPVMRLFYAKSRRGCQCSTRVTFTGFGLKPRSSLIKIR
jgi:hypothetical protein